MESGKHQVRVEFAWYHSSLTERDALPGLVRGANFGVTSDETEPSNARVMVKDEILMVSD